jgi:hypothetical protein
LLHIALVLIIIRVDPGSPTLTYSTEVRSPVV